MSTLNRCVPATRRIDAQARSEPARIIKGRRLIEGVQRSKPVLRSSRLEGGSTMVPARPRATLFLVGISLVLTISTRTACAQSFKSTGSMSTGRVGHTATLLNGGKVLVTAGVGPTFNISAVRSCTILRPGPSAPAVTLPRPASSTQRRCSMTAKSWSPEASGTAVLMRAQSSTILRRAPSPAPAAWLRPASIRQRLL